MNSNEKAINEAFDTFMSQSHYTSQQNSEKTEANPDAPMEKSQQVQSNQSVSQRKVNATQRNATQRRKSGKCTVIIHSPSSVNKTLLLSLSSKDISMKVRSK